MEAGAEREDLVGEQLVGAAAAALPPALLPPGRRRLRGGEGRSHRVWTRARHGRTEDERNRNVLLLAQRQIGLGWAVEEDRLFVGLD